MPTKLSVVLLIVIILNVVAPIIINKVGSWPIQGQHNLLPYLTTKCRFNGVLDNGGGLDG